MSKTKQAKGRPTAKIKNGVGVDLRDATGHPVLAEPIVAIPHIDVYSELPFALVERDGKRIASAPSTSPSKPKPVSKTSSKTKPKLASAAKRPAKKKAKK